MGHRAVPEPKLAAAPSNASCKIAGPPIFYAVLAWLQAACTASALESESLEAEACQEGPLQAEALAAAEPEVPLELAHHAVGAAF